MPADKVVKARAFGHDGSAFAVPATARAVSARSTGNSSVSNTCTGVDYGAFTGKKVRLVE